MNSATCEKSQPKYDKTILFFCVIIYTESVFEFKNKTKHEYEVKKKYKMLGSSVNGFHAWY